MKKYKIYLVQDSLLRLFLKSELSSKLSDWKDIIYQLLLSIKKNCEKKLSLLFSVILKSFIIHMILVQEHTKEDVVVDCIVMDDIVDLRFSIFLFTKSFVFILRLFCDFMIREFINVSFELVQVSWYITIHGYTFLSITFWIYSFSDCNLKFKLSKFIVVICDDEHQVNNIIKNIIQIFFFILNKYVCNR